MNDVRVPSTRVRILVIGYGNTLRRDDGVGREVAAAASSWGVPGLKSLEVQQLTPELAEPLSSTELAVFVDARLAAGGETVEVAGVEPAASRPSLAHAGDAAGLLAMAQAIYGRQPRAWLVTVAGTDFSLGTGLSPSARRGVHEALERIAGLIERAGANRAT
jgi:hydrogenase maturation protease